MTTDERREAIGIWTNCLNAMLEEQAWKIANAIQQFSQYEHDFRLISEQLRNLNDSK